MTVFEVNKDELDQLQKRAALEAMRANAVLGLAYQKVENDVLIEVQADGTKKELGKPVFGKVKTIAGTFKLK